MNTSARRLLEFLFCPKFQSQLLKERYHNNSEIYKIGEHDTTLYNTMSITTTTKEKLLKTAKTGQYTKLSPKDLDEFYPLSEQFLSTNQSSLPEDELYLLLFQHIHLALYTGNDSSAKVTTQKLSDRFGESSPYVGVATANYLEATEGSKATQDYLSSKRDQTDFAAFKRKVTFLKHKGDWKLYTQELIRYLETCPTDSEAWAELAEAYNHTGNYSQAVYALQECLLQYPFAYNIFARIGEITHVWATISGNTNDTLNRLKQSCQQFLRSVELCPNYVRGWSGVLVVCNKLLKWPKLQPQDEKLYNDLQKTAKIQLEKIVNEQNATLENINAAKKILADL